MVDYRERVRWKYQQRTAEGECRHYKDAFFGMADELCGRTSGERRYIEK